MAKLLNMSYKLDDIKMYETCLVHTRADRVLRTITNNLLAEFNITMMEWLLLGVVSEANRSGITLSDIAKRLDVSQPQVTALMDKVVTQRLVRQKVHKQDRRSRTAVLTIKGKRLLDNIETSFKEFMKTWLSEIPEDQLAAYASLVQRIANHETPETKN